MTAILNIISMHQAAKVLRSVKTKKAPDCSGAYLLNLQALRPCFGKPSLFGCGNCWVHLLARWCIALTLWRTLAAVVDLKPFDLF